MPEVTIRAFAGLREIFGSQNTISVSDGSTVLEAVGEFAVSKQNREVLFDAAGLKPHIILMFNGERIDSNDASCITLCDGDEIVLYPPVSGG